MKIYTKTGDKGSTSLIGGQRVEKYHARIEAYGTVDELISYLGLLSDHGLSEPYASLTHWIQDRLMTCASILAAENEAILLRLPPLFDSDISRLEKEIDTLDQSLPPLQSFIIPGGHILVSHCHVTRTICRRAERNIIRLNHEVRINPLVVPFINRLSDFLFVLARFVAKEKNIVEIPWTPAMEEQKF